MYPRGTAIIARQSQGPEMKPCRRRGGPKCHSSSGLITAAEEDLRTWCNAVHLPLGPFKGRCTFPDGPLPPGLGDGGDGKAGYGTLTALGFNSAGRRVTESHLSFFALMFI